MGLGAAVAIAATGAWFLGASRDSPTADPENASQVELGRAVYVAQCASCHGQRMEGQPNWQERRPDGRLPAPPHDASGHTWHHPDSQLFDVTKRGVAGIVPGYQSDMPAYNGILSDRQIWAVIAFIKSGWPAEIRRRQPARSGMKPG